MGNIRLKKQSATSIQPPSAADQVSLFVDSSDSILKTIDSGGQVTPSGVGTAYELATNDGGGNPVNVSSSGSPTPGQTLVAVTETTAEWKTVKAGSGLTPTAVVSSGFYDAAVGDLVPCDLSTTNDVEVWLPEVHKAGDQVGVKMISPASGQALDVWPWDTPQTIDGQEFLRLQTDYEWAIFMSDGTNWMQIG